MKKFAVALLAILLLSPVSLVTKAQGKNDTETNAQIEATLDQYGQFGDKYQLFETCGRIAVGEPWFARLYRFHTKDTGFDHWEVEGYPTLAAAVKTVEADYLAKPQGEPVGYVGHYKK